MHAELQEIVPNDFPGWDAFRQYRSADPLDDFAWFTLFIGIEGEDSADTFQVVVATPRAVGRIKSQHGSFPGLTVDHFDPNSIERTLKEYVSNFSGNTWEQIATQLRKRMLWEYEGMAGA